MRIFKYIYILLCLFTAATYTIAMIVDMNYELDLMPKSSIALSAAIIALVVCGIVGYIDAHMRFRSTKSKNPDSEDENSTKKPICIAKPLQKPLYGVNLGLVVGLILIFTMSAVLYLISYAQTGKKFELVLFVFAVLSIVSFVRMFMINIMQKCIPADSLIVLFPVLFTGGYAINMYRDILVKPQIYVYTIDIVAILSFMLMMIQFIALYFGKEASKSTFVLNVVCLCSSFSSLCVKLAMFVLMREDITQSPYFFVAETLLMFIAVIGTILFFGFYKKKKHIDTESAKTTES